MRLKAVMISVVLLSLAACQLTGGNTPTQSATDGETAISPEPVPSLEVEVSPAAVLTDGLGREIVLDRLPERVVVAGRAAQLILHAAFFFDEADARVVAMEQRTQRNASMLPLVDSGFAEVIQLERDASTEAIAVADPDVVLLKSYLADARVALNDGEPRLTHYRLVEEGPEAIGVLCGGEVRVFLQPYRPPPRLIIAGGGHIGRALRPMAEAAGFAVTIVDVEPGRAEVPELDAVTFTADTSVVLLTTDHVSDAAALRKVIDTPAQYIGMIGSSTKCAKILGELRNTGLDKGALDRVYAPVGLDLGGATPGEIAVAILAEIIAVRRGGSGRRRSRHK